MANLLEILGALSSGAGAGLQGLYSMRQAEADRRERILREQERIALQKRELEGLAEFRRKSFEETEAQRLADTEFRQAQLKNQTQERLQQGDIATQARLAQRGILAEPSAIRGQAKSLAGTGPISSAFQQIAAPDFNLERPSQLGPGVAYVPEPPSRSESFSVSELGPGAQASRERDDIVAAYNSTVRALDLARDNFRQQMQRDPAGTSPESRRAHADLDNATESLRMITPRYHAYLRGGQSTPSPISTGTPSPADPRTRTTTRVGSRYGRP